MVKNTSKKNILVSKKELIEIGIKILEKLDVRPDVINAVVEGLVWTSLRGIDSHGIRLLPHYVEGVKGGRLNPKPKLLFERTGSSTGCLDADHTFGHKAGVEAMSNAIELAKENGIGAISVRNSSHCGALSYFGHLAAEQGMIGIVFTHATSRVMSPGSNRPFFGNNPICFVAPMEKEDPFCFDAATTSITFNSVKNAAAEGRKLDRGLVADEKGKETTDPNLAKQLLPIGGYKGFGLSMVVDVLCALLSGMPSGNNVSEMFVDPYSKKRYLGHFFCAINIDSFRPLGVFMNDLKNLCERVRCEPNSGIEQTNVMVPGDPEKKTFRKRSEFGVPLHSDLLNKLQSLINE